MRKILAVLMFVVLLQSATSGDSCDSGKNAFLAKMVEDGKIAILDSPAQSSLCGTEWTEAGSCCSVDSAAEYAREDQLLLKRAKRDCRVRLEGTEEFDRKTDS